MDPKATLIAAYDAMRVGDTDTCIVFLGHYREWRRSGGFEPLKVKGEGVHGDAFASWIGERNARTEDERAARRN